MDNESLAKAIKIAKELERRKATNRMEEYDPYDYQKKFHNTLASQRLLDELEKLKDKVRANGNHN